VDTQTVLAVVCVGVFTMSESAKGQTIQHAAM